MAEWVASFQHEDKVKELTSVPGVDVELTPLQNVKNLAVMRQQGVDASKNLGRAALMMNEP